MNNIKFTNPWLLLLLIPLLLMVIIPFVKIKNGRKNPKVITSFILHLLICILLAITIADFNFLNASQGTELYVLADVSESNSQEYEKIDASISKLSSQVDDKTKIGVVAFAKNFTLLTPIGGQIRSIKNAKVDKSATDLEGALLYTSSLFKENVIKKILIISDGVETDNHAINSIEQLRNKNINVDALYLNHPLFEDEVQLNGVDFTKISYLDKEESLKVSVQTGKNTSATIKLYKSDNLIDSLDVRLTKGINVINFTLDTSSEGVYNYKVQVVADNDVDLKNNEKYFTQKITADFNVLIIGNIKTDCYSAASFYNDNCTLDFYFNGEDVPYTEPDLCKYDEYVLSNVNIVALNHHEELIINLEKMVSQYGKSLITFGTTYASGTSSVTMSKYNNMLPVQFESSDAKCVALVIDVSSSMDTDNRLTQAIEGAVACLDLLGEKDSVTVISFGKNANIVQPLTLAKNRDQIINSIRSLLGKYEYETNMTSGLQKAYSEIRFKNYDYKHVILLSDGQPTELNYETSLRNVVTDMAKNNIVSTFININNRLGEVTLKDLAQIGNGSYYYINNSADIVDVILNSVADVVTNTKIEGDFIVNNHKENDLLSNNVSNLPNIKGFNYSRIKGSANTVYTVTYINELGGEREVPLLAYWTFGKGKVVSFTSDISSSWANDFKNSIGGKTLFKNVLEYLKPKERIDTIFNVEIITNGFSTDFNIELNLISNLDRLEFYLYSPSEVLTYRELRSGDTKYSIILLTEEIGIYRLELIYHDDYYYKTGYRDTKYFSYSYSSEYNYFSNGNEQLLHQLAGENGQVSEELDYTLLSEEANIRFYDSISLYLLLAIIILFVIDIMIRKIRLNDLKFLKKRKGN